jgi:hypothetical protein
MKRRPTFVSLLLTAVFFAVVPSATASNTWYANGVSGKDSNNCKSPQTACKTIGHAVSLASSGDSILVAAATYKENLTLGSSLNILGSSASNTIIDGRAAGTVVTVSNANAKVSLRNLTIRNGFANTGGGLSNSGTLTISNSVVSGNVAKGLIAGGAGGGIANFGTLTLNFSAVSGNTAEGQDIHTGRGGGIANWGKLTISQSTLTSNESVSAGGSGGGIYNYGSILIVNSTLSGNGAGGQSGGGIFDNPIGKITISNSTLANNSAGSGGGIFGTATTTLQNSIVANNSGGNCGGTLTSNGYNLSSDGSCSFNGPGDMNNTDPLLGPLQNNGGPTQTMALLPGSLAIDAGNPSGCTDGQGHLLKTDQRGQPRPDKEDTGGCDMGAYERQSD